MSLSRTARPAICQAIEHLHLNFSRTGATPDDDAKLQTFISANAYALLELLGGSEGAIRASEYSMEEKGALLELWDICNGRLPRLRVYKREETLLNLERILKTLETPPVPAPPPESENSQPPVKRGKRLGKPSKNETPAKIKIVGAITVFYERDNRNPPTGRAVATEAKVTPNTVKNFMKEYFGSQAVFEAAWLKGDIPIRIAKIQGLLPIERHEEYDDTRPARVGYRRAGRTPGSHQDNE